MGNILILGGGFAGLMAAEKLAAALDSTHQIILVAPNRKFTFYPALVQLAFGECEADEIQFDLAAKLSEIGVQFIEGEVIRVNSERRAVQIAGDDFDGEIHYEYLIAAVGRRLATEKVPGFFENAQHLLGVKAAQKFGDLVRNFSVGTIIVGMCPDGRLPVPVCETAFALARKFESQISDGTVKINVIFPESVESAFGGANLHKELETAFKKHQINVLYDIPIREISFNEIISTKKQIIKCDLLMLVPPFRGNATLRGLGASNDEDFLKVDGFMRVHGQEKTYAAGDIVAFSGPKFAHMAVRQAEVAAVNIISEIEGKEPFEQYYHEIAAVIDTGDADSIYLHYGIWDDSLYRLKKGRFWGWVKEMHDRLWMKKHN